MKDQMLTLMKINRIWPILVALLVGLLVTPHYGESWDELKFYKYADSALEAYKTWWRDGEIPVTGNTYDNYGPAYVMAVSLGARALGFVLPWIESDLRHLLYFFTFSACVWAFYVLCRRCLSRIPSLGATILFATQPLMWGHAFISPKDIPFLTFFLLSLVFGFKMADSFEPLATESLPSHNKWRLFILTAFWLLFILLFFGGTNVVHGLLDDVVRAAAAGQENLISWIASDILTAPPEVYTKKYFALFIQARALVFWLSSALLAWFYHRLLPSAFSFLQNIAPAAILLGLTTCIRVLGPLAGLLVALYAWSQKGKRSIPWLVAYTFIAILAMYATWPYLWPDPIGRFFESVIVMAQYPWRGQVLFDGVLYQSTDLPRSYLPVLLGIQLTEPVWVLFAAGLAVTIYGAARKQVEGLQLLLLTLIWFVFPAVGFIALRSPLYDNFRQILFILPPVFILAGVIFEKIKSPAWQVALIILVVLPGVVDGIRLHPYEYIYYNRFIGGIPGASRRFELDYWGTSYREAATYINEIAPEDANIWVVGPSNLFAVYMRPDLNLYSNFEAERADRYDYVVSFSRFNLDQSAYPDAKVLHVIARDGAPLTVIKQP
jgi:hypothetical protein